MLQIRREKRFHRWLYIYNQEARPEVAFDGFAARDPHRMAMGASWELQGTFMVIIFRARLFSSADITNYFWNLTDWFRQAYLCRVFVVTMFYFALFLVTCDKLEWNWSTSSLLLGWCMQLTNSWRKALRRGTWPTSSYFLFCWPGYFTIKYGSRYHAIEPLRGKTWLLTGALSLSKSIGKATGKLSPHQYQIKSGMRQ